MDFPQAEARVRLRVAMTIDFGLARIVDAQTFGEPGERTFRLRVIGATEQSASLWMEKQHLQALDLAFTQMLVQLDYGGKPTELDLAEFPADAEHDFKVGRLALGFDPADKTVVLYVYEIGVEDETNPTLSVRLAQEHCAALGVQLKEIIGGGRPVCPLCGASIDTAGHTCIRSNGHSRQPIPEEGGEPES